ncbi:type II secretion system protein GspL [Motiliproteus sp. MSK22-1]|uniref:type II secretion system protein GspL n=1 Tax=Motiliproteus sp. MSK22-1 TaxID=1897630 RepID=UPI000977B702|nr:type II secretion system protein GspL [Motiliproteus sp. MSK22-1]OMH34786.1 hypothetical protein BGP75_10800 [Motiliproteus sp. MSK22-1]
MNNQLLIFLGPDAEQTICWVVRDSSSGKTERQGQIETAKQLNELKTLAVGIPCYAVVPATTATQFLVKLPTNSREARDAIPYQLEDQLCDDIDELHFARGPMIEENCYPVAVIAKQQMQAWADWLQEAGIQPLAMIIETLDAEKLHEKIPTDQVKSTENQYPGAEGERSVAVALHWNNRVIVQEKPYQGYAIDAASFQCWLKIAAKQFSTPLSVVVGDSECLRAAGQQTDYLTENSSSVGKAANTVNPAEYLAIDPAINLLQGDYQLNNPLQQTLRLWCWPVAIALILMLAYPAAVYWKNLQLQKQKEDVTEQLNQLYRKTFPDSQRIVNVRTQTEQRLKQLRKINQGSPFIVLLDQLLPALSLQPEVKLQSLDYMASKSQLQLSLRAPQNASIDRFSQKLTELGIFNEIKTMRKRGQFTEGLLTLREVR